MSLLLSFVAKPARVPENAPVLAPRKDLEAVIATELPMLYRVARRLTLNDQAAEDVVGQSLFLAARAWNEFDGKNPRAWLLTILRNEHLAALRRQAARPVESELMDDEICPRDGVAQLVMDRMTTEEILVELDKLPSDFRLAVTLCDIEELTYADAAKIMNVPIGTIRSRVFRGRKLLQQRLLNFVD